MNSVRGYRIYLKQYPNGIFGDEAENKIFTIFDNNEWEIASALNSLEAYRAYSNAFPEGKYLDQAKTKIKEIKSQGIENGTNQLLSSKFQEIYGNINVSTKIIDQLKIETNGILTGTNIDYVSTQNKGREFESPPDAIIIHFTSSQSKKATVNWFLNSQSKTSQHFVIDTNGMVTQMVSLDSIAWAAGRSEYDGRTGWNKYSINIVLVNPGLLNPIGNKYMSWFGAIYDSDEIILTNHKNDKPGTLATGWKKFSKEQIETVFKLSKFLSEKYEIKYVLGHDEVAPFRKVDPGPLFPIDDLRSFILDN